MSNSDTATETPAILAIAADLFIPAAIPEEIIARGFGEATFYALAASGFPHNPDKAEWLLLAETPNGARIFAMQKAMNAREVEDLIVEAFSSWQGASPNDAMLLSWILGEELHPGLANFPDLVTAWNDRLQSEKPEEQSTN